MTCKWIDFLFWLVYSGKESNWTDINDSCKLKIWDFQYKLFSKLKKKNLVGKHYFFFQLWWHIQVYIYIYIYCIPLITTYWQAYIKPQCSGLWITCWEALIYTVLTFCSAMKQNTYLLKLQSHWMYKIPGAFWHKFQHGKYSSLITLIN
jgi:hypothetical protein